MTRSNRIKLEKIRALVFDLSWKFQKGKIAASHVVRFKPKKEKNQYCFM